VLANKNDLPHAAPVERVIEALRLAEIEGREVCCYSISAKNNTNLDITMEWLIKRAKN
jgi:ADP-ribosylation factor-like protein 8